jgi:2'-5' RNA ligase
VFSFNELSPLIDKWRTAYLGIPPHITLLYPWRNAPLSNNDLNQLEQVLKNFKPFDLCLNRVETFEAGIIYLALKDDNPTKALMQAFASQFPETPLYGGAFNDVIPHLTISKCLPEHLVSLVHSFITPPDF